MTWSLRTRLTLSYVLVAILCVLIISALANGLLESSFRRYLRGSQEKRAQGGGAAARGPAASGRKLGPGGPGRRGHGRPGAGPDREAQRSRRGDRVGRHRAQQRPVRADAHPHGPEHEQPLSQLARPVHGIPLPGALFVPERGQRGHRLLRPVLPERRGPDLHQLAQPPAAVGGRGRAGLGHRPRAAGGPTHYRSAGARGAGHAGDRRRAPRRADHGKDPRAGAGRHRRGRERPLPGLEGSGGAAAAAHGRHGPRAAHPAGHPAEPPGSAYRRDLAARRAAAGGAARGDPADQPPGSRTWKTWPATRGTPRACAGATWT